MFHTVAFSASVATTNLSGLVAPIVDPTVTISGNNLLIPDKVNQVWAAAPFITAGTAPTKSQLQSPSLREVFFPSLVPVQVSATLDTVPSILELMDNPIPLQTNEGLNFLSDGAPTAGTSQLGCIVFLADGKRTPVQSSKIFTMRATSTITQAANTWVNGTFTFDQTLPVGNYDVVGMRSQATGLLAARLVFVGQSAITRPGCLGNATAQTLDVAQWRYGKLGVWGTFNSLTPPSVEVLGATGTTQVHYIDLIQR